MKLVWIGAHSKNFHAGRSGGMKPEMIVIHLMDGEHIEGCDAWFNNPAAVVSAHYGIAQDGRVHQYVKEEDTAYHTGRVVSPSAKLPHPGINPNAYTIGIEHAGVPTDVWTDAMYEASAALIAEISTRWSIPLDRAHIVGHHEIYAPKVCPGPHCDLDRLILEAKAAEITPVTSKYPL